MARMNFEEMEVDLIVKKTERAMLVAVDEKEYWIPLSNLSTLDAEGIEEGQEFVTLHIVDWFYNQMEPRSE